MKIKKHAPKQASAKTSPTNINSDGASGSQIQSHKSENNNQDLENNNSMKSFFQKFSGRLSNNSQGAENMSIDGESKRERSDDAPPVRNGTGRVGLSNLGNTCYMNSVCQALSHTDPIVDFFLSGEYQQDVNTENFLGYKGKVASAFASLVQKIWAGESKTVKPSEIKKQAGIMNDIFRGSNQQDAQELLMTLLDGLHEDLNRVQGKKPYHEKRDINPKVMADFQYREERLAAEEWYHHLKRDRSFAVDLFQGQLRSVVCCTKCPNYSVCFDPFMYLVMPLDSDKDEMTLHECFQNFSAGSKLTGDEQWYCERCKEKVDAVQYMSVYKYPPLLMIMLKRFSNRSSRKITTKVEITDVKQHFEEKDESTPDYKLYATIDHIGRNIRSGHYIAHCLDSAQGQWVTYDDTSVRAAESHEAAVSEDNYILFLEQTNVVREPESGGSRGKKFVSRQTISDPSNWPHQPKSLDKGWSFFDRDGAKSPIAPPKSPTQVSPSATPQSQSAEPMAECDDHLAASYPNPEKAEDCRKRSVNFSANSPEVARCQMNSKPDCPAAEDPPFKNGVLSAMTIPSFNNRQPEKPNPTWHRNSAFGAPATQMDIDV